MAKAGDITVELRFAGPMAPLVSHDAQIELAAEISTRPEFAGENSPMIAEVVGAVLDSLRGRP